MKSILFCASLLLAVRSAEHAHEQVETRSTNEKRENFIANANANTNSDKDAKSITTQDDDGAYLGNGLGGDDDAIHGSYGCEELQDVSVEVYVAHGQVEITMKGPQGEWFGFGFGSYRMEGTYAIIAGEDCVADYFLSKASAAGDQSDTKIDDAISPITVISDESDGFYRTIRIQRPRDHPDTFSFPSDVGNYPIISAKAVHNTHEMSYHGQNRRQENFEFSHVSNYAHSRSQSDSHSASASWSVSGSGSHSADGGAYDHSKPFHHPRTSVSGSASTSHSLSGSRSRSFSYSASASRSHSASASGSWSVSDSGSHSADGGDYDHSKPFHHPRPSASQSASTSHSLSGSGSHSFSASGSADSSHAYSMGDGCCVVNDDADVRGKFQGSKFHPLKCDEAFDRDVCVGLLSSSGADRCLWTHGMECSSHRETVVADEQWKGPTKGECVWNGQSQSNSAQSLLTALSDAAKWDAQCSALSEAECVTGGTYTHCLWVGFAHLGDLEVSKKDTVSISDDDTRGENEVSSFGCIWDETGSGNADRMSVQCERLSESECIASQSGKKDARCHWKALSHLSSNVDAEQLISMDAIARHTVAMLSANLSTMDVALALLVILTVVVLAIRVWTWSNAKWTWSKNSGYVKLAQSPTDADPLLMNKV